MIFFLFCGQNKKKRQVEGMKNFGQCVLVFILFLLAAMAILQVDRQCKSMTSYGGAIAASAEIFAGERLGIH